MAMHVSGSGGGGAADKRFRQGPGHSVHRQRDYQDRWIRKRCGRRTRIPSAN